MTPSADPSVSADPVLDQVTAALRAKKPADAAGLLKPYLEANPRSARAWFLGGVAARDGRRPREALACFQRALALEPNRLEIRHELALILFQAKRVADCIAVLAPAASDPLKLDARSEGLLAVAQTRLGRWDEALAAFDRGLVQKPGDPDLMANKGSALFAMGNHEDGLAFLREAFAKHPNSFIIIRSLIHALFRAGQGKAAEAIGVDVAARANNAPRFYGDLAAFFHGSGEAKLALLFALKAVDADPDDAGSLGNLGVMLRREGRSAEALACFEKAIARDPDNANSWNNLANLHSDRGEQVKAEAAYKRAVALDPNFLLARSNLCRVLLEIGKPDEAAEMASSVLRRPGVDPTLVPFPYSVIQNVADFETKRALAPRLWQVMAALPPDRLEGALLGLIPHAGDAEGRAKLFAAQCRWGDHVKAEARRNALPAPPSVARAGDKLRVGFLSSDLRSHNVTKFLMPIFELYDRAGMELHCYSSWRGAPDRIQETIKGLTDSFVPLANKNHRDVAAAIRDDRIDVLIEFNGITRYSQARSLAYRAAPAQVCWLGYPFTLGLEDCDFHLLDPYCAPTTTAHMREAPLLLPESWIAFDPNDAHGIGFGEIPIAPTPPGDRSGKPRFGTMNKPYKYSERTIAVWAAVLKAAPEAEFVFVRPEAKGDTFTTNMRKVFAEAGIEGSRLVFLSNPPGQHMRLYDEIDVCLDTIPQVGGTTTTESLWMGVPVVSRIGAEMYERMGNSILTNVGLGDLCAETDDAYVEKAVALSRDRARLRALRSSLRDQIKASPLCQGPAFVVAFQKAMAEAIDRATRG